jgi:glycosyltransferase involved in cell wall biosynthesis
VCCTQNIAGAGDMVESKSIIRVGLVNTAYGNLMSGLSRYAMTLLIEFKKRKDINIDLLSTIVPGLAIFLNDGTQKFGFDISSFLRTYPITSENLLNNDVIHLTQHSHATLLINKPTIPTVVTVHDIIHFINRNDPEMHIYRNNVQKWVDMTAIHMLKRANAIISVSKFTGKTLVEYAGINPQKIHPIYSGIDHNHFKELAIPEDFYAKEKLSKDTPYLLHISTEEKRKNIKTLIKAFQVLKQRYPELMLLKIGKPLYPLARKELLNLISELNLESSVIFVDYVPEEDLPYFYNFALAMAFPSIAEGFGFPVLESMACGTPVVCSDATSLPEVAGNAALMHAWDDIDMLIDELNELIISPSLREKQRQIGLHQAAKFTWKKTARQTAEIYRQL